MSEGAIQAILIGTLLIMAILELLAARQQTRRRFYSPAKQAFRGVWAIGVFVVMLLVGGVPINILWAVVFAVVGGALGFVTGRTSEVTPVGDKVTLKRASWAPWIVAITYIVAIAFLLLGSSDLYSVGLLLVLFGVAMNDGAIVAEIMKASAAGAPPKPATQQA